MRRHWVYRLDGDGLREEKIGGPFDHVGAAQECVRVLEKETGESYDYYPKAD